MPRYHLEVAPATQEEVAVTRLDSAGALVPLWEGGAGNHRPHSGQGEVSSRRGSGSLAGGRGTQPSHSLAVPKQAGLDLPMIIRGGGVCPQSVTWSPGRQALLEACGLLQGHHGPWSRGMSPEGHRRLQEVM